MRDPKPKRQTNRNAPFARGESTTSTSSASEHSESSSNGGPKYRPKLEMNDEMNERQMHSHCSSKSRNPFENHSGDDIDCVGQNWNSNADNVSVPKSLKLHQNQTTTLSNSSTSSPSVSLQSTAKSESIRSNSVHTSPSTHPGSVAGCVAVGDSLLTKQQKEASTSVPTSPETLSQDVVQRRLRRPQQSNQPQSTSLVRKCDVTGFRTSRSEDHLQHTQHDIAGAIIPIDVDEDINSSLNTLLDTRADSEDSHSSTDRDRIVWTYNAPVHPHTTNTSSSYNCTHSFSSSMSSSPQHSTESPASPTSVSSSIMSSSGSKETPVPIVEQQLNVNNRPNNATDLSVSEAVSNISSPDYQDEDNLLSSKEMAGYAVSDPSDSDSTILVSDVTNRQPRGEHKIVIKVRGVEQSGGANHTENTLYGHAELKDSEDELATICEDGNGLPNGGHDKRESSPPISDDGSDCDSLHSYHYSPKAVDIPSAVRLAKRLFGLEGFKKSDVSRHLSKK